MVIVTSIAIAYHTKYQVSPGHEKGRIGPPLLVQEEDIPDHIKDQIRELALKHAERYWETRRSK